MMHPSLGLLFPRHPVAHYDDDDDDTAADCWRDTVRPHPSIVPNRHAFSICIISFDLCDVSDAGRQLMFPAKTNNKSARQLQESPKWKVLKTELLLIWGQNQ